MRTLLSYVKICSLSVLATAISVDANAHKSEVVLYGKAQAMHFKSAADGDFYLQAATFKSAANALTYQKHLSTVTQYPVSVKTQGKLQVVLVGPMHTAAEVREVGRTLSGTSSAPHDAHAVYSSKIEPARDISENSEAMYSSKMGPVSVDAAYDLRPFVSAEGLYNWSRYTGFTSEVLTSIGSPVNASRAWGGRLAAGLAHAVTDKFAYSGELGWGYYGHSSLDMHYAVPLPENAIKGNIGLQTGSFDQWGFDALAGLYYTQPKFDLYVKAGALFQNLRVEFKNMALNSAGGSVSVETTFPSVMPEIKLGGAYHITDHVVANLSWMYAFGGKLGMNSPFVIEDPVTATMGALTMAVQNPSINAVMFGLEYRFG